MAELDSPSRVLEWHRELCSPGSGLCSPDGSACWQEGQEVLVPCAGLALAVQSPLKQVTAEPPALPAPLSKEPCCSFPGATSPQSPASREPWKEKGLGFPQAGLSCPWPACARVTCPLSPGCAHSSLRSLPGGSEQMSSPLDESCWL